MWEMTKQFEHFLRRIPFCATPHQEELSFLEKSIVDSFAGENPKVKEGWEGEISCGNAEMKFFDEAT